MPSTPVGPSPRLALAALAAALAACTPRPPAWEVENPVRPLPAPPLGSPVELAQLPFRVTPEKVRHRRYFREAFGDDAIGIDRVAEAIAAYEATRLSGNSPFDRFDAGDEHALTPPQRAGRDLFSGKAGCNQCHLGPNLTDTRFHNLGVAGERPTCTMARCPPCARWCGYTTAAGSATPGSRPR